MCHSDPERSEGKNPHLKGEALSKGILRRAPLAQDDREVEMTNAKTLAKIQINN